MVGMAFITLFTLLLIIPPMVKSIPGFMALFSVFRLFQGLSAAFVIPAVYSMIIVLYKDQSEELVGFANSASVFGIIFGPFLGLAFNAVIPWKGIFFIYTGILVTWGIIVMVVIPNKLNKCDVRELKTKFDERYSFQSL